MNRRDGVVVLSPEAGAYEELRATRCVPVHPYDIGEGADALHTRAHDARRRARQARRGTCAARGGAHTTHLARRAPHPDAVVRPVVASASASSKAANPTGPSTTTSAACTSAGLSSDRTPMLTPWASVPSSTSACRAANAGRSPASSPANAAAVHPHPGQAGHRRTLVDRHGRPELDCHASPQRCVEPEPGAASAAQRPASAPRSGWSRQCTVTATSPLRSTSRPGRAASASSAAGRRRPRRAAPARRPPPLPRGCAPGRTCPGSRARRSPTVAEEGGRTTAHHGHGAEHRDQPGRRRGRPAAVAPSRVEHDRRQGAVEVDEERRARIVDEGLERGRDGHDASAPVLRADDDDAVGVGRTLRRVGGVRLHVRGGPHAVELQHRRFAVEAVPALDHGALALLVEVAGSCML